MWVHDFNGKIVFFIYYSRKGKQKFVVIYFVCSYFLYKNLAVQKSSLYENYESVKFYIILYYIILQIDKFHFWFCVVFCSNLLINIVNYLIVIILYSLYYGHTFGWVSEWFLFNTKWTIFQLYNGENNLYSMRWLWCLVYTKATH